MSSLCQDPAEGFILNYTLLIGDASFSNFQKVRSSYLVYTRQEIDGAHRSST